MSATVPLTIHAPGRGDNTTPRRAGANARGRSSAVLQAGVAAGITVADANDRAEFYKAERDKALLQANHAYDALRDVQQATTRAAAVGVASGSCTFIPPPPDPYAAELLKRDTLIESWSRAFHDMVISRDRDISDIRSELHRAVNRANDLADTLIAAQRDLNTARIVARQTAEKITVERAKLRIAEQTARDQRDKRRLAEALAVEHNTARAQAETRLTMLQLEHGETGHARTRHRPTAATGTPGKTTSAPIPAPSVFCSSSRTDSEASSLDDVSRRRLLCVAYRQESPDDGSGGEPGSPSGSYSSSARRGEGRIPYSPEGSSPPNNRQRRESPADDFASGCAGSSAGPFPCR